MFRGRHAHRRCKAAAPPGGHTTRVTSDSSLPLETIMYRLKSAGHICRSSKHTCSQQWWLASYLRLFVRSRDIDTMGPHASVGQTSACAFGVPQTVWTVQTHTCVRPNQLREKIQRPKWVVPQVKIRLTLPYGLSLTGSTSWICVYGFRCPAYKARMRCLCSIPRFESAHPQRDRRR